jgi:hypothetical protein
MAPPLRTTRLAFRRAVIASVAIHVTVAIAIALVFQLRDQKSSAKPGVDTGVDVVIRMFEDGPSVETRAPEVPSSPPPSELPRSVETPEPAGRLPVASSAPTALSKEMLAVISRAAAVQQVAETAPAALVPPIHGALAPGKSVVYVLDCSGSMGEFGKFALARAALLATLQNQPESVRFQVVTYNSAARPLMTGGCVAATPANIEAASNTLSTLEAKGRSNHIEAVRIAIQCRPDVILILTDAENLALAQFKPIVSAAGKPVSICVSKVTPAAVATPQELR